MKLKQIPGDFHVEELTDAEPVDVGEFSLYRLEKRGWTTSDVLQQVGRRWNINRDRISYGGLKDKHAHTIQFFSIRRGPKRGMAWNTVKITFIGQIDAPFGSRDIRANRFRIMVRDLNEVQAEHCVNEVDPINRDGVVNYLDDQRFGSVVTENTFIGKLMVLGRYEDALKEALAGHYEFDRPAQRQEKQVLREFWGRWPECKDRMARGHARSLVDFLVHHPTEFRGAVARLRPDLQGMYLSAYQSHLWNRVVTEWLSEWLPPHQRLNLATKVGPIIMGIGLDDSQRKLLKSTRVSLPAGRSPLDPAAPWAAAADRVMQSEGLLWSELKVKGLRKPFFTRGERAVVVEPAGLSVLRNSDDRQNGRFKVQVTFTLPRGSYATMVVKRLLAKSGG